MKLSILTLNFGEPSKTFACMDSLYAVYRQQLDSGEFELLILDNASGRDVTKLLVEEIAKKEYRHCHLIISEKNEGFGGGNNMAAKEARGKYLLFLNNDTLVRSGIAEMLSYMQHHLEVDVLGGPLKNTNGSQQPSVGRFASLFTTLLLLLGFQRLGLVDKNPKEIRKVDWVKGALMMMKKSVFASLGGFDEKIFMYTEDMELCYRAFLAGFQIYFYPQVDVVHKEHGSSSRSFAIIHIYKNLLYFYSKHRSRFEYTIVKLLLLTKAYLAIIIGSIAGNATLVERYKQAVKW